MNRAVKLYFALGVVVIPLMFILVGSICGSSFVMLGGAGLAVVGGVTFALLTDSRE